jgi:hypothetical protein
MIYAVKWWTQAKMSRWIVMGWLGASIPALAASGYQPVIPTMSDKMVTARSSYGARKRSNANRTPVAGIGA